LHCVVGLDALLYLLDRASSLLVAALAKNPREEQEGVPPDMDLTRLTATARRTHVLAIGLYVAGNEGI
jgi:hypothetical protein